VESVRAICFGTTRLRLGAGTLGKLTPPVDATAAVVSSGGRLSPQGVVPTATRRRDLQPGGFATCADDASWKPPPARPSSNGPGRTPSLRPLRPRLPDGQQRRHQQHVSLYTNAEHVDDFEVGVKKNFGRAAANGGLL
jgi:hypothetical protein